MIQEVVLYVAKHFLKSGSCQDCTVAKTELEYPFGLMCPGCTVHGDWSSCPLSIWTVGFQHHKGAFLELAFPAETEEISHHSHFYEQGHK